MYLYLSKIRSEKKNLILDTYRLDILHLRESGYQDPWLFLQRKGVREQTFGKHCTKQFLRVAWPNVRLLGSLRPASTNEFDMPPATTEPCRL